MLGTESPITKIQVTQGFQFLLQITIYFFLVHACG
jgi:hypothetical protein